MKMNMQQNILLSGMKFDTIMEKTQRSYNSDICTGDVAGNDLAMVCIYNRMLNSPIIIPLTDWDNLEVRAIMEALMNLLKAVLVGDNESREFKTREIQSILKSPWFI